LFIWYSTTAEWDAYFQTGQAQVKYECIVTCTLSNEQILHCPSTQSQSKMRLQCSKNKEEYKQSDCIKAVNHYVIRSSASFEKQVHIFS